MQAHLPTLFHSNVLHDNISETARALYGGLYDPHNLFFHALAIMHTPQYPLKTPVPFSATGPASHFPLPPNSSPIQPLSAASSPNSSIPKSEIKLLYPECDTGFPLAWRFFGSLKLPKPSDPENLKLTAGWGRRGQGSTVMPGP